MKLLNTQKLAILKLFNGGGLAVDVLEFEDFECGEADNEKDIPSTRLKIKETDYFYEIIKTSTYVNLRCFPNNPNNFASNGSWEWIRKEDYTWGKVLQNVEEWIKYITDEFQAINEINILLNYSKNIPFDSEEKNEKFNSEELLALEQKLLQFNNYLANLPLAQNQLEQIQKTVNELNEKAGHYTKVDWKNLFIGTIISLMIQLTITPENAKAIWEGIRNFVFNFNLLH